MTRLIWVNHASFILEHGAIALLSDPWIEGTAFNDGWGLLAETKFEFTDFARITHIWFSHEHPDHFQPTTLRRIPVEIRKRITVLYQRTADRKVIDFCAGLDFMCQELAPDERVELGSDFAVRCGPYGAGDSWLLIELQSQRILNLNDCPMRKSDELGALRAKAGPLDLLLAQFSYAGWVGNRDDIVRRRREAKINIDQIMSQVAVLQPKTVVPFASFVYFSHQENFHANDSINKVGDVFDLIVGTTSSDCAVLYPGDEWTLEEAWDSAPALARYASDYDRIPQRRPLTSPVADYATLEAAARSYCKRLREQNWTALLLPLRWSGYLRPAQIFLDDLGHAVSFSMFSGLSRGASERHQCDVALSSDSLLYCLRFLWGHSTLSINGRFEEPVAGQSGYFMRQFAIGLENNQGKFFPQDILMKYAAKNVAALGRRLTGRANSLSRSDAGASDATSAAASAEVPANTNARR